MILPKENINNYHSYYIYVVRHKKRLKLMEYLKKNNIFCNISYPFPIHSMRGYRKMFKNVKDLKVTDKMSKEIFSLPMYPELKMSEIERVIKVLNNF